MTQGTVVANAKKIYDKIQAGDIWEFCEDIPMHEAASENEQIELTPKMIWDFAYSMARDEERSLNRQADNGPYGRII